MSDRDRDLVKEVLDVDGEMQTVKEQYEPVFQDIIDNVITHQPDAQDNSTTTNTLQGQNRSETMFDGTPRSALNIFANGIYGLMVSPSLRWFKLKIEDEALNEQHDVKIWLQDTEERLYGAFRRSNFYSEMKSYLKDGGSIGTANMFSQEDIASGRTFYSTLPIREFKIAEDQFKVVDRCHRDFRLTARQLEGKFGKENLTIHMKSALDSNTTKQRLQKFKIKHAVFPREDIDDTKINKLNKPWASVWLSMDDRNDNNSQILREDGFDEFPYSIWRFDKETDEIYGRSPAWHVLSEIKGAHYLEKNLMKTTELSVNPPMNVHVNMKKNFKRIPGGINYFADANEKADAMDLGINWPIGIEHQDRKRKIINEAWFVDFFLLIASRDQTMTATEVIELQGEKISILAPIVSSLSSESLDPIVGRQLNIELKAGRLLPVPEVLRGQRIEFEYIGPLAQAQERAFETQSVRQSLAMAEPIFDRRPETMDIVDWDGTVRDIFISGGFKQKNILTPEQTDDLREIQAEARAEQQQIENAETQSKTAKNIALADKASEGKLTGANA